MREKICGIYAIRNLISKNIYIGQSINIYKRFNDHIIYLNIGKHDNKHLQRAWEKYGKENFQFEIIEECQAHELNDKEIFYIDKCKDKSYNMNDGGHGSRGYRHTDETKKIISEKGKGRICSEETRKKQSEISKGRKMPKEAIERIRTKNKGRAPWCKGKKRPDFSEEWKIKIGESGKGRKAWNKGKSDSISLETLQKLLEKNKSNTYRRINFGENENVIKEYIKKKISVLKISKIFNVSRTPISRIKKEMIKKGELL